MDIVRKDLTQRLCRITGFGDLAFLFLSGQGHTRQVISHAQQTQEVLDRFSVMLDDIGSSRDELLSATLWIAEIGEIEAVQHVWDEWIGSRLPPALTIVEGRLATPEKVIEAGLIARRNPSSNQTVESSSMTEIKRLVINDQPRISRVVTYGNLVFLAGVTAPDASSDMLTQVRQVLDRIDGFLAEGGSNKHHILSATVWLADIRNIGLMNEVWDEWVSKTSPPARATVEARLASPQLQIEIGIIAAPA
jgi:enamine deaminase RidA (YjgF/YER057c/UK114 family)